MRRSTEFAFLSLSMLALLLLGACCPRWLPPPRMDDYVGPGRISAAAACQRVRSGEAVLVCAYADDEQCRRVYIEDAITLSEFESDLMYIPPEKQIIFYCG
jgi:hypothetical protein